MRNIRTNVSSFDEVRRALAAVKSQLSLEPTGRITSGTHAAAMGELITINAGLTVTLPSISADNRGRMVVVKQKGAGTVTINTDGTNEISYSGGTSTTTTTNNEFIALVSDGANDWIGLRGT